MRNPGRRWLATIAVVGGVLIAGSPAIAAQAAPGQAGPDVVGDSSQICLTYSVSYCIKSDGPGNPVTITNYAPNDSNFTVVRIKTIVGITYYQWQNGNGNCLREGTNQQVKLENGGCVSTDDTDWWRALSENVVGNKSTFDLMLVRGTPATGDYVFAYASIPAGDWGAWNVPE
jgi:hypothetical protein